MFSQWKFLENNPANFGFCHNLKLRQRWYITLHTFVTWTVNGRHLKTRDNHPRTAKVKLHIPATRALLALLSSRTCYSYIQAFVNISWVVFVCLLIWLFMNFVINVICSRKITFSNSSWTLVNCSWTTVFQNLSKVFKMLHFTQCHHTEQLNAIPAIGTYL